MVNLVVEYMDGGSLQDVVDGGGYRDELVLADIAYQVLPLPSLPSAED
jgi:serine/threonine protein kinase